MKVQTFEGQYAGFVSRLFAFGIDAIIIVILVGAIGVSLSIIDSIFILPGPTAIGNTIKIDPGNAIQGLIMSLVATIYFPFFWTLGGSTPGMFLMGVTIVKLDGGDVSFWRAIVRTIGFYLSAFFFFLGFIWILVDNRRQGWHDKLAGTCVIYSWPARPDEKFLRKRLDSR